MMRAREEDGYVFSDVFCIPGVWRSFATVNDADNPQGDLLHALLPSGVSLFGYCGFTEICPVAHPDGTFRNRAHCDSISICAW